MGKIPQEVIDRIIRDSDIVEIISEYVTLKKTGRGYSGVCPFHNDKGPSLSVSPEKQLYHCFGCGASGNVVGFIMRIRNLEYVDALKYLAERLNIPIEQKELTKEQIKKNEEKEAIYRMNILAARFYLNNLYKNDMALEYFKKRELDIKTLKTFGLGYSNPSWSEMYDYLISKGFNKEIIYKSGLVSGSKSKPGKYYDRFRNRVMFPVLDVKGRVIGFGGRVLDDSKPKYLNSPETPVFTKGINLYGLNFVLKSGLPENIIVVEGYMDCITLHKYGIKNAVASLGTALTYEQSALLKKYSRDIYICYDADSAGQTATLRGLQILKSTGCSVKVIMIPDGKDPDEFLKKNGVDAYRKLIENAVPVTEYRIQRARKGKNLRDIADKSKFIHEAAVILCELKNEVEKQAYASRVSDITGIKVEVILDEIKKIKSGSPPDKNNNEKIRNNNISGKLYNLEPAYKKAERGLLSLALKLSSNFDYIKERIQPDGFITDIYKEAARYIYDDLENGVKPDALKITSKFHELKDNNDIALIFNEFNPENQDLKLIDDYIKVIKKNQLESRLEELTIQIKACEAKGEIQKSLELSMELGNLKRQLGR